MNRLCFRFEPEDEWGGDLIVTLSAKGFAGVGRAAFNTDELRAFAKALSVYPLQTEALPEIAGGFGLDREHLTQIHLGIALRPENTRGEIRVTVNLATAIWSHDNDLPCGVVAAFLVTYGDLDRFVPNFVELLEERRDEAVLQSSIE